MIKKLLVSSLYVIFYILDCIKVAASSSLDSHIRIWDLETGKQLKAIDCGPGTVLCKNND